MSIYQEFLKKGHKINPVKDFRGLVYDSAMRYGKLPAFQLRDRIITYNQLKEDYIGLYSIDLVDKLRYKCCVVIVCAVVQVGKLYYSVPLVTFGQPGDFDSLLSVLDIEAVNVVDSANLLTKLSKNFSLSILRMPPLTR